VLVQGQGTVKPHPSFNVEEDCKILRKAMKGFGRWAVENVTICCHSVSACAHFWWSY